ncbi:MAG: RNA-binding S4 domain-containing protein, partial [Novipirellula sp. JB048]
MSDAKPDADAIPDAAAESLAADSADAEPAATDSARAAESTRAADSTRAAASEDRGPIIRLDDFLKCRGLVGTGGEAKILIQAGDVCLNGEVETRRRKQLVIGDVVDFDDQ